MRIKKYFFAGLLVLVPVFLSFVLINMVTVIFEIWNPFINFLNLPESARFPVSILLTFAFIYSTGLFITSSFINSIFSRTPVIKRMWSFIKSITDRMLFAAQGGYKIVMYTIYDNDTIRERPGIIVGRTTYHNPDGTEEKRLIVTQPPPNIFDPLLLPPEDTRIISGDPKEVVFYMFSGGLINPPHIHLEEWTNEEYDNIPESQLPEEP